MKCAHCRTEFPENSKFCKECGAKLELTSPECAKSVPPDSKFCLECGHDLRKPTEAKPLDYTQPHSYTPKHLAELQANVARKDEAFENLKKAESMFQEMGMDYWLRKAREALARL